MLIIESADLLAGHWYVRVPTLHNQSSRGHEVEYRNTGFDMSKNLRYRTGWTDVSVFPGNPKGRFRVKCSVDNNIGTVLGLIKYVSKKERGVKIWIEECFVDWIDITPDEANDEDIVVWSYWIGDGDPGRMITVSAEVIENNDSRADRNSRLEEYATLFESFYRDIAKEVESARVHSSYTKKEQRERIERASFAVSGEIDLWTNWTAVSLGIEPINYTVTCWSENKRPVKARIKYLIEKQPYRKVFEDREFQGQITISPHGPDNVMIYACAASLSNDGGDRLFVQQLQLSEMAIQGTIWLTQKSLGWHQERTDPITEFCCCCQLYALDSLWIQRIADSLCAA